MSRVAFVQGASRGIGAGIVRRLLDSPDTHRVHATCRAPGMAHELNALGADPRLRVHRLDVREEASICEAARQVGAESGSIDLAINVAGILHGADLPGPEKRLESVSAATLEEIFAVNASGPLLVAKHLLPLFRHERRSVLANVSARVGSIGDNRLGGWYGYRASKAALNMFTRTLSIEMGRRAPNAIVAAIHPGTVDTDLSRPFHRSVPEGKLFSTDSAAQKILAVLDGLGPGDSGDFFAWDGSKIPW